MDKLSSDEVAAWLRRLEGWALDGGTLVKDYKFKDFDQAMEFINRLAAEADELNHHPDWSNSYNKVTLRLTSHAAGGLTDNDFKLAAAADAAAQDLS